MREEHRIVYITNDGREFETQEKAEEHEVVLKLSNEIDNEPSLYLGTANSEEIVKWLLQHYILTPREQEKI